MLTVAMLGSFSSGKSFLISGLQAHLSYERIVYEGTRHDKFVGLLASSPTPTSSCPVRVVPVQDVDDATDTTRLWVRFLGEDEWVDLGEATMPAYVAAYTTETENNVVNRRPEHRQKMVEEAELTISRHRIPVTFYDLPGHSAPRRTQDEVIRQRMRAADAYVYVCRAGRTLDDSDLEMIRTLYVHHAESGKPVLWVVTAIDSASNLGADDRLDWQVTAEANTEFVRDAFEGESRDRSFVEFGFLGVSAALEARGLRSRDSQEESRDSQEELAAQDIATSNMGELRDRLNDLVARYSGVRHIQSIAEQAMSVLLPHLALCTQLLATERVPYEKLLDEKKALRGYSGVDFMRSARAGG